MDSSQVPLSSIPDPDIWAFPMIAKNRSVLVQACWETNQQFHSDSMAHVWHMAKYLGNFVGTREGVSQA